MFVFVLRYLQIYFQFFFFFFQAEDGIRDLYVTGVQTCALPISSGPLLPSRSTADMASRRLLSQDSACSPTSRTHQASASDRDRATPASTSVSSTLRSGCRSRVITGADSVVNSCRVPPASAPQATFRR